jgi:hypothetical protein
VSVGVLGFVDAVALPLPLPLPLSVAAYSRQPQPRSERDLAHRSLRPAASAGPAAEVSALAYTHQACSRHREGVERACPTDDDEVRRGTREDRPVRRATNATGDVVSLQTDRAGLAVARMGMTKSSSMCDMKNRVRCSLSARERAGMASSLAAM